MIGKAYILRLEALDTQRLGFIFDTTCANLRLLQAVFDNIAGIVGSSSGYLQAEK